MKDKALELALDFVEKIHVGEWAGSIERQLEVITAIKEALAQPEEKQKTDDLSSYVQCISDAAQTFFGIKAESQYCYQCNAFERASHWWNEHHGGDPYINPTKYFNDDKMVTQPEVKHD